MMRRQFVALTAAMIKANMTPEEAEGLRVKSYGTGDYPKAKTAPKDRSKAKAARKQRKGNP